MIGRAAVPGESERDRMTIEREAKRRRKSMAAAFDDEPLPLTALDLILLTLIYCYVQKNQPFGHR